MEIGGSAVEPLKEEIEGNTVGPLEEKIEGDAIGGSFSSFPVTKLVLLRFNFCLKTSS